MDLQLNNSRGKTLGLRGISLGFGGVEIGIAADRLNLLRLLTRFMSLRPSLLGAALQSMLKRIVKRPALAC